MTAKFSRRLGDPLDQVSARLVDEVTMQAMEIMEEDEWYFAPGLYVFPVAENGVVTWCVVVCRSMTGELSYRVAASTLPVLPDDADMSVLEQLRAIGETDDVCDDRAAKLVEDPS